jgi:uncharacterized membrane protein YeaQ/YmgE (transglycosylase-associated protein family)
VGIISWIVVGLIAGLLAKFLLPGDDPGGLIVTTLIGMAGAVVGGILIGVLGGTGATGFNVWSILVATLGRSHFCSSTGCSQEAAGGSDTRASLRNVGFSNAQVRLPRQYRLQPPTTCNHSAPSPVSRARNLTGYVVNLALHRGRGPLSLQGFAPGARIAEDRGSLVQEPRTGSPGPSSCVRPRARILAAQARGRKAAV